MRTAIAALALFLFAGPAGAGTRFVAESRDLRRAEAPVRTSVLWLDGARLRLEADGANTIIYRAAEDMAWVIDHRARSYRTIDRKTTETAARGIGQAAAAARRTIESLPPAQRQAAERLLGGTLRPPTVVSRDIEVRPRGASERIAGVPCAVYDIRRGGRRRADVCRSTFEATGTAAEDRDAVRALADSLSTVIPVLAPEHLRQDGVDALYAFERLDGVPLRVRLYEKDAAVWETRVTQVAPRTPPATAFDVPAGYERQLSLGGPAQRQPAERSPH